MLACLPIASLIRCPWLANLMLFTMLQDNETPGNEEWSIQEPGFVACSVQSYVFLVLTFWRVIC